MVFSLASSPAIWRGEEGAEELRTSSDRIDGGNGRSVKQRQTTSGLVAIDPAEMV
jgi:hypothetical protein